MREQRFHVGGRAAREAEQRENGKRRQQPERHHVLKDPARFDAAVVDDGDEDGERQADRESRRVNRAAADRVHLVAVERGEDARQQVAGRDGFPRTDDGVREDHRPSRRVAGEWWKDAFGVCDFGAGVANPLHQPAIGVRNREQQQTADEKAEDAAGGAAARQPVVHQDEPADADHRAEAEREVLDGAQPAAQFDHRDCTIAVGMVHSRRLLTKTRRVQIAKQGLAKNQVRDLPKLLAFVMRRRDQPLQSFP